MAQKDSAKMLKLKMTRAAIAKGKNKRRTGRKQDGSPHKDVRTFKPKGIMHTTGQQGRHGSTDFREDDLSKEELEAEVRRLQAKLSDRGKEDEGRIPKPKGTAGNSYNLCTAMGLDGDPELYETIRTDVREIVHRAGLDYSLVWNKQPLGVITRIFDLARERHPILRRYAHDWATADLVKGNLRRTRYYRKSGRDKLKNKRLRAKGIDRDEAPDVCDSREEEYEPDMGDRSQAADAEQSEQELP
ncbi:hypothetical protein ACG7TL_001180 [Trametes sanguinea]